jgi:hypothetical protein
MYGRGDVIDACKYLMSRVATSSFMNIFAMHEMEVITSGHEP